MWIFQHLWASSCCHGFSNLNFPWQIIRWIFKCFIKAKQMSRQVNFILCNWSVELDKGNQPIGKIWSSAKQQYNYLIVSLFLKNFSLFKLHVAKCSKIAEKKFPKWGSGFDTKRIPFDPPLENLEWMWLSMGETTKESFNTSIPLRHKILLSFRF